MLILINSGLLFFLLVVFLSESKGCLEGHSTNTETNAKLQTQPRWNTIGTKPQDYFTQILLICSAMCDGQFSG